MLQPTMQAFYLIETRAETLRQQEVLRTLPSVCWLWCSLTAP